MTNVITTYCGGGDYTLTVWNRNGELLFDVEDIFNIAGFQDPNIALSEVLFSDAPDVMFVKRRIEQEESEFDSQLFTNLPGAMSMAERTFYYHPVRQEPPNIEAVLNMLEHVVLPALEDDSARDFAQQIEKGRKAIHDLRHPSWEASLN